MHTRLLAAMLAVLPAVLSAAEQVIEVPPSGLGAIFVNSKARKLYVGWGHQEGEYEKGLFVFDIDADGTLTGHDERVYPNSPDPFPQNAANPYFFLRAVGCMMLSRDGHKLYLGVQGNRHSETKPLVVYDLDEKGEPKGKARNYAIGNFHTGISHMLLDPKLDLIYTIGWGGSGLFTMPVGKDGEPTSQPQAYGFGYNAKTAMIPDDRFTSLTFGGQAPVLEVCDTTPEGTLQLPPTTIPVPDVKDSVRLTRVGKFLYFVDQGRLFCWGLDKESRPIDNPKLVPGIKAVSLRDGVQSSLYVVEGDFGPGAKKDDPPKLTATRIARYKPDEKGALGKPAYVSETFERKQPSSWTVDEATATIYASFSALP